jgi:hypothetical protein
VVNTIVAHERAEDLAAITNMELQSMGIAIGLEVSPANLRGLSHREWGDATSALAILMETTNPAQGRLRGRTDSALVLAGQDHYYEQAAARNRLSVPFDESGWPIAERVGRHLAGISTLVDHLGLIEPDRRVKLLDVPTYEGMRTAGVGAFLR